MPKNEPIFYVGDGPGHAAEIQCGGVIFNRGRSSECPPDLAEVLLKRKGFVKGNAATIIGVKGADEAAEKLFEEVNRKRTETAKAAAEEKAEAIARKKSKKASGAKTTPGEQPSTPSADEPAKE